MVNGWDKAVDQVAIGWLILMGCLYITGALLYAVRIPERFFPGKLDIWVRNFTWGVSIHTYNMSTGRPIRMLHRKWRENKQDPSRARSGHQLSCCLVSLHFLCDILSGRPAHPK